MNFVTIFLAVFMEVLVFDINDLSNHIQETVIECMARKVNINPDHPAST